MKTSPHRFMMRALITRALADKHHVEKFAIDRWGPHCGVPELLQKASVGGITSGSPFGSLAGDDEFFAAVRDASLIGRLVDLRAVAFNVRTIAVTQGANGYWVGESKPIPLSKAALAGSSLERKKVGAIMVAANESLQDLRSEKRVEADLIAACAATVDQAFVDATNTGSADMPAAIVAGATPIASTGNPATDVAAAVVAFGGNLQTAVWITDATTAAKVALARDASGAFAFPDVGVRGGSILGAPLFISAGSPRTSDGGQLVLLDPAAVAAAFEEVEISVAQHANIEMSDAPTGASDTPVAASVMRVSLFQTECTAFKAILSTNWELQHAGAVAVVTGCDYSTGAD